MAASRCTQAGHLVGMEMRGVMRYQVLDLLPTCDWGKGPWLLLLLLLLPPREGGGGGCLQVPTDVPRNPAPCALTQVRFRCLWDGLWPGCGRLSLLGGGVTGAPENWARGSWQRAPVTGTTFSIGTKGTGRKALCTMADVKRRMHACPPHATPPQGLC